MNAHLIISSPVGGGSGPGFGCTRVGGINNVSRRGSSIVDAVGRGRLTGTGVPAWSAGWVRTTSGRVAAGVAAARAGGGDREAYGHLQSAARVGVHGERCVVGGGDGLDDGKPEPEALAVAGALGAEALEGLE